jgi:hypothetical protein
MGAIGRERIAMQLSWEHSAPELMRAYERVFAKFRAPTPNVVAAALQAPQ